MKDHKTKLTVNIKKGSQTPDRNGDGVPDVYIFDPTTGLPTGVDADGDGVADPYDIDNDGTPDTFITDPAHGGPGWDTEGKYPQSPTVPDGLGNATNGVPDLSSPGIELGTSVNLEWEEGLELTPSI